ncbi:MAG: hypothetical protein QXT45_08185 [Candidatus Bilamarchaeaceae archaeon]
MPASYPTSVKFFTTKSTGQIIEAAHINEPQEEIVAIEQGLLQGLQHDLIPDAPGVRSLGTPTRQWLAVLKRLRVGDSPGITRVRTITNAGASETWITVNADYDGSNWNRDDVSKPARAIRINDDKSVDYLYAGAGTNPITWSGPQVKVIADGSGLLLQGDPTDPMHATTKQYVDNSRGYNTIQSNGTPQPQRYILNFTAGLAASDDSSNNRTNVSVVDDTSVQKVEVSKSGSLTGARKRINFLEGSGIIIDISDDPTNNEIDVAISSAAAVQAKPFLVATSANIPASGGAILVRVDATNETWYELEYPDGATYVADFEIPAVATSQWRFAWRTPGNSGACRWVFEVREKGNGDLLGGGTVVASAAVNDTAPSTANQIKVTTLSMNYTPGTGKSLALLRVARIGGDAADTLTAAARLLWIELLA